MAETIRGLNIVIGSDTVGLNKALGEVDKSARSIQSELRQVEKLLKFDPSNTELISQKQKLLADAVATTKTRLDALKEAQSQVNDQFARGEISEGKYRAFQREITKTEQELKKLEDRARSAGVNLEKLGKTLSKTGSALTKGVTLPLLAAGAAVGKVSIDFETAFAGVRKTVDATEDQFAELERGIRLMAKEIPVAATEIAGIAEAAGQLGIETKSVLSFTRTMADLGVTTNMSAQDAASALARLANITQMSQGQFDRLGSAIVALGNNLATTESEIVDMALRVAGAGAQVGMTEAQILAFAAALSSVGIAADAGGSAISKVMVNIASEVAKGGEKLNAFASVAGMTAEEFSRAWREDAAAALAEFIEGLGRMSRSGQNVFGVLEQLGMTETRVRDAMLRAAGAGDLLRRSIDLSTRAWEENNALAREAEQRYTTAASKLETLWNKVKDAGLSLGQGLVPALTDAVDAVEPLINVISKAAAGFAELDKSTQRWILITAGIAAGIGPGLTAVGKATDLYRRLSSWAARAAAGTTALGTASATATPLVSALGSAVQFLLGPWGLLIAGGAALVGVLASMGDKEYDARLKTQDLQREAYVLAGTLEGDLSPAIHHVAQAADEAAEAMQRFDESTIRGPLAIGARRAKDAKGLADALAAAREVVGKPAPPTGGGKTWLEQLQEHLRYLSLDADIAEGKLGLLRGTVTGSTTDNEILTQELGYQRERLAAHARVVDALTEALDRMRREQGENSREAKELTLQLLQAQKAYQDIQREIDETNKRLKESSKVTKTAAEHYLGLYIQRQVAAGGLIESEVTEKLANLPGTVRVAPTTSMLPTAAPPPAQPPTPPLASAPITIQETVNIYGDASREDVEKALDDSTGKFVSKLRLVMPGVTP
jgi:TP901 family phage tail tape measure protein